MSGTKTIVKGKKPKLIKLSRVWLLQNPDSLFEYGLCKEETKIDALAEAVPPCVIELVKGAYALCDGHHRLLRLNRQGAKSTPMYVLEPGDVFTAYAGTQVSGIIVDYSEYMNGKFILTRYAGLRKKARSLAYKERIKADCTNAVPPPLRKRK